MAGGGTSAVDFSYSYDANGRVTHITDHATTGQDRAYTYDPESSSGQAGWGGSPPRRDPGVRGRTPMTC